MYIIIPKLFETEKYYNQRVGLHLRLSSIPSYSLSHSTVAPPSARGGGASARGGATDRTDPLIAATRGRPAGRAARWAARPHSLGFLVQPPTKVPEGVLAVGLPVPLPPGTRLPDQPRVPGYWVCHPARAQPSRWALGGGGAPTTPQTFYLSQFILYKRDGPRWELGSNFDLTL